MLQCRRDVVGVSVWVVWSPVRLVTHVCVCVCVACASCLLVGLPVEVQCYGCVVASAWHVVAYFGGVDLVACRRWAENVVDATSVSRRVILVRIVCAFSCGGGCSSVPFMIDHLSLLMSLGACDVRVMWCKRVSSPASSW